MRKNIFLLIFILLFSSVGFSTLLSKYQKIISLSPYITEILYNLGEADSIVGVTLYCNRPSIAKNKPKIGGMINPNLEEILKISPDLIFATKEDHPRELIAKLQDLGFFVVILSESRTFKDIKTNFFKVAEVVGKLETAVSQFSDIERKLKKVDSNKLIDTFIVLADEPLITVSQESYLNDILAFAGFRNIVEQRSPRYPIYSREAFLKLNPEFILNFTNKDILNPDIFLRANPYAFLEAVIFLRENYYDVYKK
ncbi:MAG: ABC transporter substrate-binding protein [bacterium]|nr:ABC transporter substrate-binding protein [bacterium]